MHYLYLIAKDCQSFDEVLIIGQVMIYNTENEIIIGNYYSQKQLGYKKPKFGY